MSESKIDTIRPARYEIALPCEPENFSSFIGSLLGKPQTISGFERGAFELRRDDVINSYHLVTQRVMQQNEATLIQFIVTLAFDDDGSVVLNSLDDFINYTEVRPVVVTQAHLSWSFLVKFRDRGHPEKQEIDLSFLARIGSLSFRDLDDMPFGSTLNGRILFRIRHTARTWGADIENLLIGHAKHLILPQPPAREFTQKHSGKIGAIVGLLFFINTIAVCFRSATAIANEQLASVASLLQQSGAMDLKFNRLLKLSADGFWGKYFFSVLIFVIFSLVISIVIGFWASETADTHRPSYILLTKKSEQNKVEKDGRYKFRWLSFLTSIGTSVITGIVANIIFTKYWAG